MFYIVSILYPVAKRGVKSLKLMLYAKWAGDESHVSFNQSIRLYNVLPLDILNIYHKQLEAIVDAN